MSFISDFKNKLTGGDEADEKNLGELQKEREKLKEKARAEEVKKEIEDLKKRTGSSSRGVLGKIGGAVKDLGASSESRALSELVGPREPQERTEEFVMGLGISRENGDSVPGFLLGDTNPEEPEDIGIDFPHSTAGGDGGSDEDLGDIMKDQLGVNL